MYNYRSLLSVLLTTAFVFAPFAPVATAYSPTDFSSGSTTNVSAGEVVELKSLLRAKHTTQEDLEKGGRPAGYPGDPGITSGGEVVLGNSYDYTEISTPSLPSSVPHANHTFVDPTTDYLYVSMGAAGMHIGLVVIDLAKDELLTIYDRESTPSLEHAGVTHSFVDPATNYLYVSSHGGLSVIDLTNNTLVTRYHEYSSSEPTILDNSVNHTFLDSNNNHIYVSTSDGLSVIDLDNDTVVNYTSSSSPAIAEGYVNHTFLDSNNNHIYVSTSNGLSVIDLTEDELVATYSTNSTPAIKHNNVKHSFLDSETNHIYVSTSNGLSVIDLTEDELVATYDSGTIPEMVSSDIKHSFLDSATKHLYVSTTGGLLVIDPTQNEFVTKYDTKSTPAVVDDHITHSFIDPENNRLYISTSRGVSIVGLGDYYMPKGEYVSAPIPIDSSPVLLEWQEEMTAGQDVKFYWRAGGTSTAWFDDFDDLPVIPQTEEELGVFGGWEAPFFSSVTIQDGVLTFEDAVNPEYTSEFWIDTELPAKHFPQGSTVRARVKFDVADKGLGADMFYDGWQNSVWFDTSNGVYNDEWQIVDLYAEFVNDGFSSVAFGVYPDDSWNNETDSFQIDWVSIEAPDSEWGEWQECTTSPCEITTLKEDDQWLQYKIELSTDDASTSPSVSSVTLSAGYETTGTYTSEVIDATEVHDWQLLAPTATTPEGTSIAFETRSGDTATPDDGTWSAWEAVTDSAIASPDAQYLQYRATLETTDSSVTPTLSAVDITHEVPTTSSPRRSRPSQMISRTVANTSGESSEESMTPSEAQSAIADALETLRDLIGEMTARGLDVPESALDLLSETSEETTTVYTRDLTIGSEGNDVRSLQSFLNNQGFMVATTGAGAPGQETSYFGTLTRAALARFQESVGISPAVGYFGSITRSYVNSLLQ